MSGLETLVASPVRLAAVARSGLLDTAPEEPFDRLTRLACELLGAPFGFVTVVDERRSFWKSCIGVPGPDRQNPVGESFCQYVINTDGAVIIGDARLDPMTRDNPSIESMGVIAWAGFPVRSPDGQVLGSFCVVDNRSREWNDQDLRTLEVLSHAAGGEVALRIAADESSRRAERYQQLARSLQESLLPRQLPRIGGLDLGAAYQLGGDDVHGDFYDVVQTPTGWGVFLGDVAGRGAHAARTGALAKYTLRAQAARASSPAIVLTDLDAALHRWFAESADPGFVTVAYLALRARRIRVRRADLHRRAPGRDDPARGRPGPGVRRGVQRARHPAAAVAEGRGREPAPGRHAAALGQRRDPCGGSGGVTRPGPRGRGALGRRAGDRRSDPGRHPRGHRRPGDPGRHGRVRAARSVTSGGAGRTGGQGGAVFLPVCQVLQDRHGGGRPEAGRSGRCQLEQHVQRTDATRGLDLH